MKKIVRLLMTLMCSGLLMIGCGKKDASLNDLKPMLMVDGKLYLDTGVIEEQGASITAFDKEIVSTVEQTERPAENGQSNFGCVGNSYAVDDKGVIVVINDKWVRFELE